MPMMKRYDDGHWWLRLGRFTIGTQVWPWYATLGEHEGWKRVWRFGRWSATYDRQERR